MLSITIELTAQEEQEVRKRIALRDRTGLQHILVDVLTPAVESFFESRYVRPDDNEFGQLSRLLAEKSEAHLPKAYRTLPPEALSRAGIYEE